MLRKTHRSNYPSILDNKPQEDYLQTYTYLDGKHRKQSSSISDQYTKNSQEINQRYLELNRWINNLDSKVQKVINYNQVEMLNAYRQNFAHIKVQLQSFKQKNENQADSSSSLQQRIQCLEKQLAIFRQDSLKLFNTLISKNKDIDHMKMTLEELISEKRHMDQVIKDLLKRNKEMQIKIHQHSQKDTIFITKKTEEQDVMYSGKIMINNNFYKSKDVSRKARVTSAINGTKYNSQTISLHAQSITIPMETQTQRPKELQQLILILKTKLKSQNQGLIKEITQIIQQNWHKNPVKRSIRSELAINNTKLYQSQKKSTHHHTITKDSHATTTHHSSQLIEKSQKYSQKQEIMSILKMAIETVKKQITRGRNKASINFFKLGNPITMEQFKNMDFVSVMQIVCQSDTILQLLYKAQLDKLT